MMKFFYVKIAIGQEGTDNYQEKIQKLTIIQGDVVKYEENFSAITYNGTWYDLEDERLVKEKLSIRNIQEILHLTAMVLY